MTRRSFLASMASVLLAAALIAALAGASTIDPSALAHTLIAVRADAFAVLVLLIVINVALAARKWRLVDLHLGGAPRPEWFYLAFTGVGQAAGQMLPVQIALVLSRTLGSWLTGRPDAVRGAKATLIEQAFDFVAVALLAAASAGAIATGNPWLWAAMIAVTVPLALWIVAPALRAVVALARRLQQRPRTRLPAWIAPIAGWSGRDIQLARRLLALSLVRFTALCLMAAATTWAVGLDVPAWHLAVALPVVVLATAVPITPGGIGVNEWTFTAVLVTLGTPAGTAIQWALLNRLLVCAGSLLIGAAAALLAVTSGGAFGRVQRVNSTQ